MNQNPSTNIIHKIKNRRHQKPTSKYWFRLQNFALFLSVVTGVILAFISFNWLISQAKIFYIFWPFIASSWSGWIWVVIPEFAVMGLVLTAAIYLIYRRTDWFGVAWADVISLVFVFTIIAANTLVSVNAFDQVPAVESIHQTLLTTPYRIWLRDQHIIDLTEKKEYYGVVAGFSPTQISIDHGGVVLDFGFENASELSLGQRVWVSFEGQGSLKKVIDYRIW